MRLGIRRLREGNIILLDPEGTRSHDGRLQKGQPGAILMALHSGAPVLPVDRGYGVSEYYTEMRLPLVEDKPMLKSLSVDAGYRYSDYNRVTDLIGTSSTSLTPFIPFSRL